MATDAIDDERARALGAAVAAHSHEDLPAARVDELSDLTSTVYEALETGTPSDGAALLLEFWTGHVSEKLGLGSPPESPDDHADRFENGFEAGAIGVDLYQALTKVLTAMHAASTTPDFAGWTDRLFELTNRHVAHLESHQHEA